MAMSRGLESVVAQAEELESSIDEWISLILQKELKTFQHVYQHEGRLLIKIKDLLGRMHGGDIPLTNGFRDVTRDYLKVWDGYSEQLERIKDEEIPAFNALAEEGGASPLRIP